MPCKQEPCIARGSGLPGRANLPERTVRHTNPRRDVGCDRIVWLTGEALERRPVTLISVVPGTSEQQGQELASMLLLGPRGQHSPWRQGDEPPEDRQAAR